MKNTTAIIEIKTCTNGARAGKFLNVESNTTYWKFLSRAELAACEDIWHLEVGLKSLNVIDYVAQSGEITRRVISATRIWQAGNGNLCVRAYCHKRAETRTFNHANIAEVVA